VLLMGKWLGGRKTKTGKVVDLVEGRVPEAHNRDKR
jgi:hypothetical protein